MDGIKLSPTGFRAPGIIRSSLVQWLIELPECSSTNSVSSISSLHLEVISSFVKLGYNRIYLM